MFKSSILSLSSSLALGNLSISGCWDDPALRLGICPSVFFSLPIVVNPLSAFCNATEYQLEDPYAPKSGMGEVIDIGDNIV